MLRIADGACDLTSDGAPVLTDASRAVKVAMSLFADLPHEQVWCVLVNGRNALLGAVRIAEGGLHGCAMTPGDVLRPVLLRGAPRFFLFHNHPSGDPTPSVADFSTTKAVDKACEVVGVSLVDHVVVCPESGRWASLYEMGVIGG